MSKNQHMNKPSLEHFVSTVFFPAAVSSQPKIFLRTATEYLPHSAGILVRLEILDN